MIVSSGEGQDIKIALAHFVAQRQGLPFPMWGEHTSIGLVRGSGEESRIAAAVIYNNFDAANVFMHIGAEKGCHWLTAAFLRACFEYPFEQLQKNRVTAVVAKKNKPALRFVSKLGFKFEGCMRKHYPDDDMMMYGMLRTECNFLSVPRERVRPVESLKKVA